MRVCRLTILTLLLAAAIACRTTPQPTAVIALDGAQSTSLLGHWVLATPIDSTAFAGAVQVDLVLAAQSFSLTAAYANRAPLTVAGTLAIADGGLVTFTPTTNVPEAAAVGFGVGKSFTRVATASGASLLLTPPSATTAVPSSSWYRLDAARLAGIAR